MTPDSNSSDQPAALGSSPLQEFPAMTVTVLGSGTSTGIPVIGCTCPVCTSDDPRNKRLRTSIKVETADQTILVDCGVDFRQQMLTYPTARIDAVLITHATMKIGGT